MRRAPSYDRWVLRHLRAFSAVLLAAAAGTVFVVFAGGGASSTLHQYQYQYQYGPQTTVGLLATIRTNCPDFQGGRSEELDEMRYRLRRGEISALDPWSFYYWTRVRAPATTFTVDVVQSVAHPSFTRLFGMDNVDQVQLLSEGCADLPSQDSAGQGQARVVVTGAIPGRFYIVQARYLTRPLLGQPAPNPSTVHYDFTTKLDGVVVASDGLDLKKK
jgi:hypothetical protein